MVYVLVMSTDQDIINETLDPDWDEATTYQWEQIQPGNLDIPDRATVIVVAHGNNDAIGNAGAGVVDINAAVFLALVQSNMAAGAAPARVFISACAENIAGFAGQVALLARENNIWHQTEIFGHTDPVAGQVPAYRPRSHTWAVIYQSRS
jgi:hypothetical protein